jgi:hypothetical protein
MTDFDISRVACVIKLGVWGEPPAILLSVYTFHFYFPFYSFSDFHFITLYNRDDNSSFLCSSITSD